MTKNEFRNILKGAIIDGFVEMEDSDVILNMIKEKDEPDEIISVIEISEITKNRDLIEDLIQEWEAQ